MYQPNAFIGLVNGLHHLSFPSQVMSHDLVHFLLAHHFTLTDNTSYERTALNTDDVQSLNVVTMVVSWLTFCHLMHIFWTRSFLIWGWGGEGMVNYVRFTYTTYNITNKVFLTCYGERFTSYFCVKFCSRTFGIFYTKPIILMS